MLQRVFLAAILILTSLPVQADRLDRVVTWPTGPAVLKTGNQIRVEWRYLIEDRAGAYMFARPLKDGALAADYAASGSSLSRGEGEARAEFTLQSPGEVDAIRIQIVDQNRQVRHQTVVPVQFRFAQNPMAVGASPTLQRVPGTMRPRPSAGGDRPAIRPLLPADRLRPMLDPDIFSRLTPQMPDDFELPGGGNMQPRQNLATVPPSVDVSGADEEWIAQLENWMGHIVLMMGFDIMRLMGDSAEFDQYIQMEQADGPTIYEVLDRRRKTIGNLLDGL